MFLGIDLGTSSVKTILMDEDQNIIATASAALTVQRARDGWSEQDPESWWVATCDTLDQLKNQYAKQLSQVKGIGLSGQMHGATLLDKNNQILHPAILWNDTRSAEQCKTIEAVCSDSRELAGNIAMPGFTAPKILWLKENKPAIYEQIAMVLLPKDYLRFRLCGEFVSDLSDASGTLWLNVGKRDWSEALLSATGLDRSQMPRLVEGSAPAGQLKDDLRQRWGIEHSVMIAGGAGDNAAAACGMGAVTSGQAFLSLGTSGVLFVCNDQFSPNTQSAIHAFCHAIPETWHQMGVILSASDSLQWLSMLTGKTAEQLTTPLIGNIERVSEAVFLPYLGGERTPHNDANARGAFAGLTHAHGVEAMTQAVLEGVGYAFRDCQLALQEAGTDFEQAFVVGGGARSEAWLTILASILGRPLLLPAAGEQGAALGAARLGLCAAEGVAVDIVCKPPTVGNVIEPSASLQSQYETGYARYRELYPAVSNAMNA